MRELSMTNCINKNGPLTKPCDCSTVCASRYGVEVRRLRAEIGLIPPGDVKRREQAIERWQTFIKRYAPQI